VTGRRRRLLIWRHGETDHNVGGIWQGHLDTDLSVRGLEQARTAAGAVARFAPDLIVTSDLRRAAHTAAELAGLTDLPVRRDERLREIDVGAWQGLSQGDVAERFPDAHAALARGEDVRRGEHGETVEHVRQRALAAARDALAELEDGRLGVLCTHGVTARTLAAALVGLDQHTAWLALVGLRNCHWAELAEQRTGWRIVTWNSGVTESVLSTSDR
jgi:glucosyl-3-phosphoglycerate phosphatase